MKEEPTATERLAAGIEEYNRRGALRSALHFLCISLAWFALPATILWGFGATPLQAVRYACAPYLVVAAFSVAILLALGQLLRVLLPEGLPDDTD